MKTYLLFTVFFYLWLVSHAQTPCVQTHKGEVLLRTAQGKNARGIVIAVDGNSIAPTDQNGVFQCKLTKCPGMSVKVKVSNDGYGIVNHVEMSLYTLRRLADPNDFQFSVIISPNNQTETDRIAYYSLIAGLALDKGLAIMRGKIAELEKVVNVQQQKSDRLLDSLATLRTQYAQANQSQGKRQQEIEEIAKIFAQRTEIDSSYQQAFKLYKNGKPIESLRYLSDEKMQDEKQNFTRKRILAKRLDEEAQREKEFYLSKCLFKAVIYRNLFDMKNAEKWYREAVTTDTTNINNLLTLAIFLDSQNRPIEPEYLYKKILSLKPDESNLSSALHNLGNYYATNNKASEAEKAYLESRFITERLVQRNPNKYEPELAITLNSLGNFYETNNRLLEAKKYYLQAQSVYEHSMQKNSDQYEYGLANTFNNLGSFYSANNYPVEAEKAYSQARSIYEHLVKKNPYQYKSALAGLLNNFGLFYSNTNQPIEAERIYLQAYTIYDDLSRKNPDQYEPSLAHILIDP